METRARTLAVMLAMAGAIGAGACLRPSVFACESDASCLSRGVQGICQPTGYCSYPSDACESGQRYDEFAGAGLAETCTEPLGGEGSGSTGLPSTSGGSSETGPEGTTTGGEPETDTEACPPPVDCADEDGDGYGEGADCQGTDCDDDNPAHHDQCIYVSPDGNDGGAGTREEPWLTFERALPELSPGESLVLLPGLYEPGTTGLPDIECFDGGNADSGTAEAPISIRAEQERLPVLVGNGSGPAFSIDGCQHWRILGLRGRNGDLPGSQGGSQSYTMLIRNSQDIVARRLLFSHNNRYFNTHLYGITGSQRILVEESEAYYFHREGFFLNDVEDVTLRRCYARANDYADLPDCNGTVDPEVPYCSGTPATGDAGFGAYRDVLSTRFENCIADGAFGTGFRIGGSCHDNQVVASASIGAAYGVRVSSDSDLPTERNEVIDTVVVSPSVGGVLLRSATDAVVRGLTVLDSGGDGLSVGEQTDCAMLPGGCSVDARHVLALRSGDEGVTVSNQDAWLVQYSNAFGSGSVDFATAEDIGDDEGNVRASTSIDAGSIGVEAGQCAVFVPDDSPMKGAGEDGADLGATMLLRVEGELTEVPLWDPRTGAFPCGAIDRGLSDDPIQSCIGVHERLNVATNGCALPPGYGESDDPCE